MKSSLISPQEASDLIARHLPPRPVIRHPLSWAAGLILHEPIVTDRDMPPFDRVTMDGYAFRLRDIEQSPDHFQVTGVAYAGHPSPPLLADPGLCIEVMTGSVLPAGADLVIPYEWTERAGENAIRLIPPEDIRPRQFIHPRGSDAKQGEVLAGSGRRLGSREAALAASCGYCEINCSESPTIGIVTSGDELVDVGITPLPHEIRRSNDEAIDFAVRAAGLTVHQHRLHLKDQRESDELSTFAADVDLLILTGGVSKGKRDHMPDTLQDLDLDNVFHGIAQRPGKPMGFWTSDRLQAFALPGNPLSALVCLHRYVIPGILGSMGAKMDERMVQLASDITFNPPLTCFKPVHLDINGKAAPVSANTSGDFISIMHTDGFVELPAGTDQYEAGLPVKFIPWL